MFSYYTSILIICWIALFAMCILVRENDRIPRINKRLFYLTYILVAVSAFAEWCGLQLDGRADIPGWTLKAVKCADYILTPASGGALMLVQMRFQNRWRKVLFAVLGGNAVLQLVAVFCGWTALIDE